jgi:hypothetical protein
MDENSSESKRIESLELLCDIVQKDRPFTFGINTELHVDVTNVTAHGAAQQIQKFVTAVLRLPYSGVREMKRSIDG